MTAHPPLRPLAFTGNPLNRAADKRCDSAWLSRKRAEPDTRILPLWSLQPLLRAKNSELAFLTPDELTGTGTEVFLGLEGDTAYFARDVSAMAAEHFAERGVFSEARPALALLGPEDAAILGQAKALIDWHKRHGFCANCGRPTSLEDAGYKRRCISCGSDHFPRTDPAVIMLVTHGETCLLGHNRRFAEKFFSTLAGFVEPGETIEDAVRREVFEESGVRVGNVTYYASQPWPFPASLMIGCFAESLSQDITIDGDEILEAAWFARDHVRALIAGEADDILLPRREAIAFHLLRAWAEH
jgi:NAD+ diphosphatase